MLELCLIRLAFFVKSLLKRYRHLPQMLDLLFQITELSFVVLDLNLVVLLTLLEPSIAIV